MFPSRGAISLGCSEDDKSTYLSQSPIWSRPILVCTVELIDYILFSTIYDFITAFRLEQPPPPFVPLISDFPAPSTAGGFKGEVVLVEEVRKG